MKSKSKLVEMKDIIEPAIQIREEIGIDAITELAESIKEVGLIQPISLRKVENGYEIIAGHRRFLAHKQLGRDEIEAKIFDADEDNTILIRVHENLYREDITAVDEANIVGYLHYECKWELNSIQSKLRKSRAWVENRIDIFHMPEEIKNALREKKIAIAVANELMKVDEIEKRKYFLEHAILHGATAQQVQGWRIDFIKESFVPITGDAPVNLLSQHEAPTNVTVECFVCGAGCRVIDTIAINTCRFCWSEFYKLKKQREQTPI